MDGWVHFLHHQGLGAIFSLMGGGGVGGGSGSLHGPGRSGCGCPARVGLGLAHAAAPHPTPWHLQALFKSTVQLVLLPTVLGIAANEWFKKQAGPGCQPVGGAGSPRAARAE